MRAIILGLLAFATLAGCSSAPTPPPEPDMTHLVDVNRYVPSEIDRNKVPKNATAHQGEEE